MMILNLDNGADIVSFISVNMPKGLFTHNVNANCEKFSPKKM